MEIKYAKSFKDKLFGLMFKKNINFILCFDRCNSIHTFFMRENINVFFADKNNKILKTYKNVPPNRILICWNAYYTYETPVKITNI